MSCGLSRFPRRATVCCRRLVSPVSASSGFGERRRESGQSRGPEPPAITIANIGQTLHHHATRERKRQRPCSHIVDQMPALKRAVVAAVVAVLAIGGYALWYV